MLQTFVGCQRTRIILVKRFLKAVSIEFQRVTQVELQAVFISGVGRLKREHLISQIQRSVTLGEKCGRVFVGVVEHLAQLLFNADIESRWQFLSPTNLLPQFELMTVGRIRVTRFHLMRLGKRKRHRQQRKNYEQPFGIAVSSHDLGLIWSLMVQGSLSCN